MKLELDVYSFSVGTHDVVSIWIMVRNAHGEGTVVHLPYADKEPYMRAAALDVRNKAQEVRRLLEFAGHDVEVEPALLDALAIENRLLNCPHQ